MSICRSPSQTFVNPGATREVSNNAAITSQSLFDVWNIETFVCRFNIICKTSIGWRNAHTSMSNVTLVSEGEVMIKVIIKSRDVYNNLDWLAYATTLKDLGTEDASIAISLRETLLNR